MYATTSYRFQISDFSSRTALNGTRQRSARAHEPVTILFTAMFPSETFLKPGLVDRKMWTSYQGLRVDVCLVTLIVK